MSNDNRPLFPPGLPSTFTGDAGGMMAASVMAPIIYCDLVTMAGINAGGVAHMTLEAIRHMADPAGTPLKDSVAVCHLRMDLHALARLKAAIEQIETLVRPEPAGARN